MTSRNSVCLSWGKAPPATASARSSAPWLSSCFTSTSLWFWVRASLGTFGRKINAVICDPFTSARYWWTKPRWGWISAEALRGTVPKCELILETLHHNMESCIRECICLLAVCREPSCSSTLQGSPCSKGTSHLWVLLTHLQPQLMLFFWRPRNTSSRWTCFPAGPGKVLGLHCGPGGVAPDPPPVLLGADVGLFLWIKMEGSVSLRWPALQREQVVTGAAASTTSELFPFFFTL